MAGNNFINLFVDSVPKKARVTLRTPTRINFLTFWSVKSRSGCAADRSKIKPRRENSSVSS